MSAPYPRTVVTAGTMSRATWTARELLRCVDYASSTALLLYSQSQLYAHLRYQLRRITFVLLPQSFTREGDSLWVRIGSVPQSLIRHILPKGFIAVDGTSLTVCEVDTEGGWFTFMLIAHTQAHIALPHKAVGERVNLEADVLGKYASQAADAAVARVEAAVAKLESSMTAKLDALLARVAALESKS